MDLLSGILASSTADCSFVLSSRRGSVVGDGSGCGWGTLSRSVAPQYTARGINVWQMGGRWGKQRAAAGDADADEIPRPHINSEHQIKKVLMSQQFPFIST